MKIIIKINPSIRRKLMKLYGASYPTIRRALASETDNYLARQIRQSAIENGGIKFCQYDKK